MNLAEQFEILRNNVYPSMLEDLATELGVTVKSLERLGVGFYPDWQCWVFAERNAKGDIIGMLCRTINGKKLMIPDSKRGLIYAYNSDHEIGDKKYDAGKFHWVRIANAGVTCPICAKPDWCMVSSDDPKNPSAVLCSRIAEGSIKEIQGSGFLHVIDSTRNKNQRLGHKNTSTTLPPTKLPIIIVEGTSDVLAAMSLGFVSIGRPSAKGGMEILKEMPLVGHEVWIIGENDAGAGKEGMQKTYLNIKHMTEDVQCVLPPKGIKDLRQWVQSGLTQEALFEYVGQHSDENLTVDPNIFVDDTGYIIADQFMRNQNVTDSDVPTLRSYHGQWVRWSEHHYENIALQTLRGEVYKFLEGKKYVKVTAKGIEIVPYKPTARKINDILDALNSWCPIIKDPPTWLDDDQHISPSNLIAFQNGMLDINEYVKGNVVLHNPDPRLFTYNVFPYDFDPETWSNLFEDTYKQWLNDDSETIRLLSQWFGYNLVPDMSQEKLMIFTGPRRSGKGTALVALQGMLGKDQYCATSFNALAKQFGCAPLVGKLAATLGDAKTPRRSEADAALGIILEVVGRDAVPIRQLYQPQYNAHLCCRFTIAMNGLPAFTDHAQAFAGRSNIIHFPNTFFGKEDTTLKGRIGKEAQQGKLINFALWGLKDLRESGRFVVPRTSAQLTKQLTEITSPVIVFIEECCIMDKGAYILKDQLFEAWQYWCVRCGRDASSAIHFGRWLRQICPGVQDFKPTKKGRQQYAYKGITLQDWVYSEFLGKPKSN